MKDFRQDQQYVDMKAQFDEYYEQKLKRIFYDQEKVRHRYFSSFVVLILLALCFYPAVLYYVFTHFQLAAGEHDYTGYVLSSSGVLIMILCGPMFLYKSRVKPEIMPKFAEFFGTFSYDYGGTISDRFLYMSKLFGSYNRNVGDDYFKGQYDGVNISIAEEKLKNVVRTSQGKKEHTVFRGICIMLEMNKNFSGQTVVLHDKGIFNALNFMKGLQTVRLEDSKFEKYFEVYSDNQIEARYLLTTAFMERILKLKELFGGRTVQFSFYENQLLIAIKTRQNMFEANSFFCSNLNKQKIEKVFDQFYMVFSIINILKLNQRIGM